MTAIRNIKRADTERAWTMAQTAEGREETLRKFDRDVHSSSGHCVRSAQMATWMAIHQLCGATSSRLHYDTACHTARGHWLQIFSHRFPGCSTPGFIAQAEGAHTSTVKPMVVDDPSTKEVSDYWLHPCECAPHAWGPNAPLSPAAFEDRPPKSNNSFILHRSQLWQANSCVTCRVSPT